MRTCFGMKMLDDPLIDVFGRELIWEPPGSGEGACD